MKIGDRVSFSVYDNLFKDVLHCTGVIKEHILGRLWLIAPHKVYSRLSGIDMQVHEDYIDQTQNIDI